ncbi:hypothetical protein ACF068_20850 [Streptomyces sp. NPDC016309]|uniref:hypothetical protein n=1 Tax=Streptomyces sp. NPDC016309 TaxID=3364965 RepID=UPI0037007461
MAISRVRIAALSGLIGVFSVVGGISAFGAVSAAPQKAEPAAAADLPWVVEDFSYPGAAQIEQNQQIMLRRGDGHITLTTCEGTPDILVKSRTGQKSYCFDVNAARGYLALELPDVFGLWTEDHPVQATVTADGKKTTVEAAANGYKALGEGVDKGPRSVLVELRVTG